MWHITGYRRDTEELVYEHRLPVGTIPEDYDIGESYPVKWEYGDPDVDYFLEYYDDA
jgi:hypothetical protein